MSSTDSLPATVAAAIEAGANLVRAMREARGYTIEDLAVTCGLSASEITGLENGEDSDPGRLRRIATALGLPDAVLTGS